MVPVASIGVARVSGAMALLRPHRREENQAGVVAGSVEDPGFPSDVGVEGVFKAGDCRAC